MKWPPWSWKQSEHTKCGAVHIDIVANLAMLFVVNAAQAFKPAQKILFIFQGGVRLHASIQTACSKSGLD
jgi:hypothetical protein